MYCPRCAAQNLDDAKFCRACGADIRLVPQALLGNLNEEKIATAPTEKPEKKRQPATLDAGLKNIFQGLGLLIIFLTGIFVFRGAFWVTLWFIIPALASFGEGLGQLIRARQERERLMSLPVYDSGVNFQPAPPVPAADYKQLSSPDTAEMVGTPVSVTEVTTRHLDVTPLENGAKDA